MGNRSGPQCEFSGRGRGRGRGAESQASQVASEGRHIWKPQASNILSAFLSLCLRPRPHYFKKDENAQATKGNT